MSINPKEDVHTEMIIRFQGNDDKNTALCWQKKKRKKKNTMRGLWALEEACAL